MSPILPKTVHAIALFLIMSENTPIKAVLHIGAAGGRGDGAEMVMSKFRECQVWQWTSLIRLLGNRTREGKVHASLWGVGGVNF